MPEFESGQRMLTLPTAPPPYLSVVVAARNDHPGNNTLVRMQAFLNSWLENARRYDLPSEIIVVEWNPPANRPKLIEALEWPDETRPCEIRFIEVSQEIHRRFKNAAVIPLHLMIAKNAGVRRARGEFVLTTNPDILPSPELVEFLAERRLEGGTIYRIDRHDVAGEIPHSAGIDELTAYCENHVLRILSAEGSFELGPDGLRAPAAKDIVPPDSGISFGSGCYPVESDGSRAFRWLAEEAELIFKRAAGAPPALILEVETGPSAGDEPITLQILDPARSVLASLSFQGRRQLRLQIPDQISTATLRFRVRSAGIPLDRDPRTLNLRLFEVRWDDPSLAPQSRSLAGQDGEENTIRVRSIGPRRVELDLDPGLGSSLESLKATLRDRSGNTLFQVSTDQLQPARGREYVLTLDVGFALSGRRESSSYGPAGETDSGWLLELTASQPGVDWSSAFEAPSPSAAYIHNAAHLHTNASGDFTLLSRGDWFDLRGYAEFPIWPLHIDDLFCYAAHHAGIKECVLREPLRIFHLEHSDGVSSGEPAKPMGVPMFDDDDVVKWIAQMRRFNAPVIFTQQNWGLGDVDLPERTVSGAAGNIES